METEDKLSKALEIYHAAYESLVREGPLDEAELTRQLILKARRAARDGGIARALVKVLLPEVKTWPARFNHPDFATFVHFDADHIEATREELPNKGAQTKVSFDYKEERYGVIFVDLGWSSLGAESYHHGRAELFAEGELVLGLDIAHDKNPTRSLWNDFGLYAFRTGGWIEPLIAMTADIETRQRKTLEPHLDAEARDSALKSHP